MTITELSYKDLIEYWDYQRKLEYNRELLKKNISKHSLNNFHPELSQFSEDEIFKLMWDKITNEDYEDPPTNWVPKNDEYRLWNEVYKKGRPVVLRAKLKDDNNL